jgi:hypothetical protein
MYQPVSNRGHKIPVLPDKWSKETYKMEARYGIWKVNENFR